MTSYRQISPVLAVGTLIAFTSFATLAGAWFIELVLGIKPCHLCLLGRLPHYFALPLACLAALLASSPRHRRTTHNLFVLLAAIYLVGTGLSAYHAGVEIGMFQGPTDCTGPLTAPASMDEFLKQLDKVKIVRCDEVAMRIFGLSLAAWNAVICFALTCLSAFGAHTRPRAPTNAQSILR